MIAQRKDLRTDRKKKTFSFPLFVSLLFFFLSFPFKQASLALSHFEQAQLGLKK